MLTSIIKKRVIIAASMSGGAEAVAPLCDRLRERGDEVHIVSYGAATASFNTFNLTPNTPLTSISSDSVGQIMASFNPTHIITGTQVQDKNHPLTLEQMFWQMGRKNQISSVAVLDTWVNYLERFSNINFDMPQLSIRSPLIHLPSLIAVPDEFAQREMVALGFSENLLRTSGNPYFEYFATKFAQLSPNTRDELLLKPVFGNFSKDGKLVVFFSDTSDGYEDIGFTEKSVLASFMRILDTVAQSTNQPINLIVRPHPFRGNEAKGAFDSYDPTVIRKVLHNPITARGTDPVNFYSMDQLLASVDLVVGTFNNPLETAKIVGKTVLSYVPNMAAKYRFQEYLNDQGLTTRVNSEADLSSVLSRAITIGLSQKKMTAANDSINRVIALLDE